MTTATMSKMTKTFSQAAFDRYVAQQIKSMVRLRTKGHRDWKAATDEQIRDAALVLARVYAAGTVWTEGAAR